MEVVASLRFARISPQKARLVVDMIRGKKVSDSFQILDFLNKKAARIVRGLLASVVANAEHNNGLDVDNLSVTTAYANVAPKTKRFHARAKGRGVKIVKHMSHLTIKVSES